MRTTTKRRHVPRAASELEGLFLLQLAVEGTLVPEQQYRFSPPRRWRADFCWPQVTPPILVEIDGGTWNGGRHVSGGGYQADCEKLNAAALLGWLVLRFTGEMVRSGEALETVKRALALADGKRKGAA